MGDPMSSPRFDREGPLDRHGRPLRNLRVSVTDRCNLRCSYCMPERDYVWLPRRDLLSYEEISRLVDAFALVGVDRVRLTGGEPLLRRDLGELVASLAAKPAIREVALTTNGLLLREQAEILAGAGLSRLTVSLDTLDPERFERLTGRAELERALDGIRAAGEAGFRGTKLNCVVMRGRNDDELGALLELGRSEGLEVRFIEYMDVGGATHWRTDEVVPREEILERLAERYGPPEPFPGAGTGAGTGAEAAAPGDSPSAPAERYRLPDGLVFGIIASTTAPFCGACDRGRLTADGQWLTCLYASRGLDLRAPLRAGATPEELVRLLAEGWGAREDRGAEERLALARRGASKSAEELRGDPHLEMHTRGG